MEQQIDPRRLLQHGHVIFPTVPSTKGALQPRSEHEQVLRYDPATTIYILSECGCRVQQGEHVEINQPIIPLDYGC